MTDDKKIERVGSEAIPGAITLESAPKETQNETENSPEMIQRWATLSVVWRARVPYKLDKKFRAMMFEEYGYRQIGDMLKMVVGNWLNERGVKQ